MTEKINPENCQHSWIEGKYDSYADGGGGQYSTCDRCGMTWYEHYGSCDRPPIIGKSDPKTTGACFIATVVYGSVHAPEVQVLRDFRDHVLMESGLGRKVVDLYYSGFGERTAEFIRDHASFMIPTIRKGLDQLVNYYQKYE